MRKIWLLSLSAFFFCLTSCHKKAESDQDGFKVYKVDLDKKIKPFEEIFSKAEVIPLETTDSCLIIYMNKITPIGDEYFVHEREVHKLYVYGQDGKFRRQISRYGQGPNEYISMFDCVIDAPNNDIFMLSPLSNNHFGYNIFLHLQVYAHVYVFVAYLCDRLIFLQCNQRYEVGILCFIIGAA